MSYECLLGGIFSRAMLGMTCMFSNYAVPSRRYRLGTTGPAGVLSRSHDGSGIDTCDAVPPLWIRNMGPDLPGCGEAEEPWVLHMNSDSAAVFSFTPHHSLVHMINALSCGWSSELNKS